MPHCSRFVQPGPPPCLLNWYKFWLVLLLSSRKFSAQIPIIALLSISKRRQSGSQPGYRLIYICMIKKDAAAAPVFSHTPIPAPLPPTPCLSVHLVALLWFSVLLLSMPPLFFQLKFLLSRLVLLSLYCLQVMPHCLSSSTGAAAALGPCLLASLLTSSPGRLKLFKTKL